KQELPDSFQISVRCQVDFLRGSEVVYATQRSLLRTLCVRFGTAETERTIMERQGNLIQFSHDMLALWKNNSLLKSERQGNPGGPFLLTMSKQGGDITVAVNGDIWLKHHDDSPIPGRHK